MEQVSIERAVLQYESLPLGHMNDFREAFEMSSSSDTAWDAHHAQQLSSLGVPVLVQSCCSPSAQPWELHGSTAPTEEGWFCAMKVCAALF